MSGDGVDSWYHEKESAWLYRKVAACEADAAKAKLFAKLGAAAEHQADKWQASQPGRSLQFEPSLRARIVARLLEHTSPRSMRHVLAAMKLRGLSVYTAPAAPTAAGHVMPTTLAQVGESHRGVSGGNFRAAVFGVNDGLVS
ncbi:MAG: hypothetical protein U1F11_15095, partial [Steroidobacteraceae bacterium]